jgi:hypothetical protein
VPVKCKMRPSICPMTNFSNISEYLHFGRPSESQFTDQAPITRQYLIDSSLAKATSSPGIAHSVPNLLVLDVLEILNPNN